MADENHTQVPVPEDGISEPSNGNEQESVELAPTSQKDEDDVKGDVFCVQYWGSCDQFLLCCLMKNESRDFVLSNSC